MIKKVIVGGVIFFVLSVSMNSFAVEPSADFEKRIQRLERMAENPVLLRLTQQVAEQRREIASLHNKVDLLQHQLERIERQASSQYLDLNSRLSVLEEADVNQRGMVPSDVTKLEQDTEEEPKLEVITDVIETRPATDEEREIYQQAFDLMKQKKFVEAVGAFQEFKKSFPESSLASNSAYWAGEGLLVLGEKNKALEAFAWVKKYYPNSSKAADSLLRQADTLRELDKITEAKYLYNHLITKFPDDRPAKTASIILEELK